MPYDFFMSRYKEVSLVGVGAVCTHETKTVRGQYKYAARSSTAPPPRHLAKHVL